MRLFELGQLDKRLDGRISGQTHEIYNLCDIDATSESRKFEKSICHFFTNRKRPFFLLANKRARRIMNLVARLNKL